MTSTSESSAPEESVSNPYSLYRKAIKRTHSHSGGEGETTSMNVNRTLRMDVIETMTNVLRYADRIRKQRQHTANYVVSLESALDDANAAIDNAVVSLNEFMSIISDDFDVGLCSLEKNWKGTLKEIEKGSLLLSANITKQKDEIDKLAVQYLDVVGLIEDMRDNFRHINDLAENCSSFDERFSSLENQVKSYCGIPATRTDTERQQLLDESSSIRTIVSEMSLMIHRLRKAQQVLQIVKIDENPNSSEITSFIEKAMEIQQLLLPKGELSQLKPFICDSESE